MDFLIFSSKVCEKRACCTDIAPDSKAELFPLPAKIILDDKIALQFKTSLYSEKTQSLD